MTYQEQLRDPRWQKKRLKIFERDAWQCTRCSEGQYELHVHHANGYRNGLAPWEYDDSELKTLCCHCHKAHHIFEKYPGIVVTWVWLFDDQKGPEEVLAWTGGMRERSSNVDDEFICIRTTGETVHVCSSMGMSFIKPDSVEAEGLEAWVRECLITVVKMDGGST